jgi:cytochrome c
MYAMILNHRPLVILGLLIIAFLFSTGCTQNPAPVTAQIPVSAVSATTPAPVLSSATPAVPPVATKEEMVAFVNEAVTYAKQNGKEKALAEFSNPNGSFFRGVLYIYAYDMNGTTIAHPVNPEKIGVSRLNEKDAEGNLFIQDLRQAAINGTGFVTYYYINPTHKNTVEKKLGYAMIVDSTWWLGSGIYQGPADTRLPPYNETPPAAVTTSQGK